MFPHIKNLGLNVNENSRSGRPTHPLTMPHISFVILIIPLHVHPVLYIYYETRKDPPFDKNKILHKNHTDVKMSPNL